MKSERALRAARAVSGLLALGASLAFLAGCGGSSPGQETARAGGEKEKGGVKAVEACLRRTAEAPSLTREPRADRKRLKSLHLTLDGYPDAEDAGILLAARRGYFAAAGLDLEISSPVITRNVPGYLAMEASDLGILPQPQVTIADSKGMRLIAIGSVVRRPTMAMIWLQGSGIENVADLRGKTIAINSLSFEEAALEAVLARGGLTLADVKLERVAYELVQALAGGQADAILGGSGNVEGVELEGCGVEPTVIPLRRLGVPPYEELDVVVRRARLARDPELFHAFMSALARGVDAAVANPGAAAEAVALGRAEVSVAPVQRPALTRAKVEATLPLLSGSGRMNPARAGRFAAWLRDQGAIRQQVPVSELLTNRLVEAAP